MKIYMCENFYANFIIPLLVLKILYAVRCLVLSPYYPHAHCPLLFLFHRLLPYVFSKKTSLAGVEPAIFRFVV